MVKSKPSSSSLASSKGGKNGHKRESTREASAGSGEKATDAVEGDVPASDITRPTPDAILADEADPDALLGDESDSDPGEGGKRDSSKTGAQGRKAKSKSAGNTTTGEAEKLDAPQSNKEYRRSRQLFDADNDAMAAANGTGPGQRPLFGRTTTDINGHDGEFDDARSKDLRSQLTGLNDKLVASYERTGDLEDSLSQAQEQLARARKQIEDLEKERGEHLAALNTGLLVEKEHVSTEMQKMMDRLVLETAEKGKAVDERAKIEAELDDLSSSLFAEANKMVAIEKLARARAEEKSSSMEERLKDTEEIMEQQQKRLVELQGALEAAEARTGDTVESSTSGDTALTRGKPRFSPGPGAVGSASIASLHHLKLLGDGRLRIDVVPFIELRTFLNYLRKLRLQLYPFYSYGAHLGDEIPSQPGTPTIPRFGSPAPNQTSSATQSSSSPFAAADVPRHKDFPSLPANAEQLVHVPSQVTSHGFLKRLIEEDSDPCLRLDIAPGLNWLSRRQMHTAILEGNLMIEPIFGGGIYNEEEVRRKAADAAPAACAMCGKAIVNVPLPGGGSAPEASGWTSAATSLLPRRDSTASPPLGTGMFSPTGVTPGKDASSATPKSRSSIFNTLRSISGSSRNFSASAGTSHESPAQMQAAALIANLPVQHPDDPWTGRAAPIPTHIFRISEESTARYLLCPDYCLRRLRATCEMWGYIRALERAVVLEGKYAFDNDSHHQSLHDRSKRASGMSSTDKSRRSASPAAVAAVEEETETVVKEVGDAKADQAQAGRNEASADGAKEAEDKTTTASTSPVNERGELITGNASNISSSDTESMHSLAGDDDEPAAAKSGAGDDKNAIQGTDGVADSVDTTVDPGLEGSQSSDTALAKVQATDDKPTLPSKEPPPLPPRTPAPPPPPSLGPEPRRVIDAVDPEKPSWEEKVWLEVNRLRADLWAARIGVVPSETS